MDDSMLSTAIQNKSLIKLPLLKDYKSIHYAHKKRKIFETQTH